MNNTIRSTIYSRLQNELEPIYTYHSAAHTLDVTDAALRIAKSEGVSSDDLIVLEAAALLHDTGYLIAADNHEEHSCTIASKVLPAYHFSAEQIEQVLQMIRATKLPQTPLNHCSRIICDADLDYLGRDDYFDIAHLLYLELKHFNKVQSEDEWKHMQIQFLSKHSYFTETSQKLREPAKQNILAKLKNT